MLLCKGNVSCALLRVKKDFFPCNHNEVDENYTNKNMIIQKTVISNINTIIKCNQPS